MAAARCMVRVFGMFTDLSRISPRFAARLVNAGVLNTLEDMATMALWREAVGQKAGAYALLEEASRECLATFGRSVPQVSRQGYCRITCCSCLFAPNEHPTCSLRTWHDEHCSIVLARLGHTAAASCACLRRHVLRICQSTGSPVPDTFAKRHLKNHFLRIMSSAGAIAQDHYKENAAYEAAIAGLGLSSWLRLIDQSPHWD